MPTTTAMTNTLESALINLVLNGTSYTAGQVTYIGILSAAGSDSSQTEMSGSGTRPGIAFQASTSGGAVTNTGVVSFTNSGWGSTSVYGVGFYTTNGTSGGVGVCLLYGNFDSVVTVAAGQSLQFNIGGITISMD